MKAVLERKKAAETVIAAGRRWAASCAQALAEVLRPVLREGETMPDLELLQRLFVRVLERHWRRLEAADQAHCRTRDLRRLGLAKLAAATSALYRRVVDLRALLRGIFGTGPARRLLGLAGKTSHDPVVLERQAGYAAGRLRDGAKALPPAAYMPSADDRQAWARPVEDAAGVLEQARGSASRAGKALEAAVAERRRALARFNQAFVPIAGWLEALYRAAGCAERAAAVRPSRRRQGALLADEDRRRVRPPVTAAEPGTQRGPHDGTAPAGPDRRQVSPPAGPSREQPAAAQAPAVAIRRIA